MLWGFDAGRYQLVPILAAASAFVGIVAPDFAVNFATAAIAVAITATVAYPAPHYVVAVLGAAAPAVAVLVAGAPALAVLGAAAPTLAVLGAAAPSLAVLGAAAPSLAAAVHTGAAALLLVPSSEHVYPQFFTRLESLKSQYRWM